MDFLSSIDKQIDVTEAVINNEIMHLNFEFEKLMLEHQENMLAINEKIIMESGTIDDYYELCMFEAEDTKEKGKNIISRLLGAISKLFKSIKKFLFGKKESLEDENLPDKVKLPNDPKKLINESNEIKSGIKALLNGNSGKLKSILAGGIATGAIIVSKSALKNLMNDMIQYSNEEFEDIAEKTEKINNLNTEDMSLLQKGINKLSSIGNDMMAIVKAIPDMKTSNFKDIRRDNAQARKDEKDAEARKHQAQIDDANDKKNEQGIMQSVAKQGESTAKGDKHKEERDKLANEISEIESKIKDLKKSNGAKNNTIFSKIEADREQKTLTKLNKKKGKLNDSQEARRRQLDDYYGDFNAAKEEKLKLLNEELKNKKAQLKVIDAAINDRRKDLNRAQDEFSRRSKAMARTQARREHNQEYHGNDNN